MFSINGQVTSNDPSNIRIWNAGPTTGIIADSEPPAATFGDFSQETGLLLGAIHNIQDWATRCCLLPSDVAALFSLTTRLKRDVSRWQTALSEIHRPAIPNIDGKACPSYHEYVINEAALRLTWLAALVTRSDSSRWTSLTADQIRDHRAAVIAERFPANAGRWDFPQIDFDDVSSRMKVECRWMEEKSARSADATKPGTIQGDLNSLADRLHELSCDLRRLRLDTAKISAVALWGIIDEFKRLKIAIGVYANPAVAESVFATLGSLSRRYTDLFVVGDTVGNVHTLQAAIDDDFSRLRDVPQEDWPEDCPTILLESLALDINRQAKELRGLVSVMNGKRHQELEAIGEAWKGGADSKPPKASGQPKPRRQRQSKNAKLVEFALEHPHMTYGEIAARWNTLPGNEGEMHDEDTVGAAVRRATGAGKKPTKTDK